MFPRHSGGPCMQDTPSLAVGVPMKESVKFTLGRTCCIVGRTRSLRQSWAHCVSISSLRWGRIEKAPRRRSSLARRLRIEFKIQHSLIAVERKLVRLTCASGHLLMM